MWDYFQNLRRIYQAANAICVIIQCCCMLLCYSSLEINLSNLGTIIIHCTGRLRRNTTPTVFQPSYDIRVFKAPSTKR